MGVFNLIHTSTGECLLITTDYHSVCNSLTEQEARSGEYHIEIRDNRGHICNAIYSLSRETWVLQKIK